MSFLYGITITVTDAQDESKQSISTISYNTSAGSRIFGSVAKQTDTLGKEVLYFYDNDKGYLLAQIAPDGNGIAYQYDDLGFLDIAQPAVVNTTKTGYTANTSSSKVDYDYDSAKRLSKVTTNATSSRTTVYSFTYDNFGNNATISVGNRTLASYSYNANNGKLKELTYGNGLEVNYIYDTLDRISEIQYNIGVNSAWLTVYSYTYDTSGNLFSVTDHINDEVTMLHYDAEGKLIQSYVYDSETYTNLYGSYIYYDEHSRVYMIFHSYDYAISGGTAQSYLYYAYDYNETNGSIELLELSGDYVYGKVNPAYDNFGRTSTRTFDFNANDTDAFYNKLTYDYVTSSGGYESSKVSKLISEVRKGSTTSVLSTTTYNFTYDDNGNIKKITNASGTTLYEYSYDALGQLIRENNQSLGYTYVYEYDNAGNITAKKRYAFTTGTLGSVQSTINYTYGDSSWGDLLTKFGNTTISYDTIGNPISIGAQTLTWQGRRLTSWNDGEYITVNFGYNADSIRTYKEIIDSSSATISRYEYVLSGTQIIKETVYENSSEAYTVIYLYDENGSPIGIKYRTPLYAENKYNVYFFEKNLQGDIVAVYNSNGTKIGTYTYDAWGSFSITTTSGISTLENLIVRQYNPFRYRGYYYDSELGFYYLNSRYYNPSVGRFINADEYINANGGFIGFNMFAYCNNMPVNYYDPSGALMIDTSEPDGWSNYTSAQIDFIKSKTATPFADDNDIIRNFEAYVQMEASILNWDYQQMEDAILSSIITGEPWAYYNTTFDDPATVYLTNYATCSATDINVVPKPIAGTIASGSLTNNLLSDLESDLRIYNRRPQDKFFAMGISTVASVADTINTIACLYAQAPPSVGASISTAIYYVKQSLKKALMGY